jgi:hypothetical protein
MAHRPALIALLVLLSVRAAGAADLHAVTPSAGFRATCEDLGTFCYADECGRDQIAAAQNCRARCPSAAIIAVVPASCRLPGDRPITVLHRRG